MGALCCCFQVPENPGSNNANSDDCFLQKFINKLLHRGVQTPAISLTNQQTAPLNHGVANNNRSSNASGSCSRNTASTRSSQEQTNEARAKREIGAARARVQPEPSNTLVNQKSTQDDKVSLLNNGSQNSESSVKVSSSKLKGEITNVPVDEDECPTCFDGYSEDNPKIIMKCSHHFHLSCIYEWMERSVNCPVCDKLMVFAESS